IGIDIRTIPAQKHPQLRKQLQALLGPEVELTAIVDVGGIRTSQDDPFVRQVSELVASVTGEVQAPGTAPYFTDASVLAPAYGSPTVVLGPGEMALCHQTDEHCRVDRIEQAAEIYTRLARQWCGA